jgi:hypothetical protein
MKFGFEYEVLFACPLKDVHFRELKKTMEDLQGQKKTEADKWIVNQDDTINDDAGKLHWENSTDSPTHKYKRCNPIYYDDDDDELIDDTLQGTAEIVSPILKGYNNVAPAFKRFGTLLANTQKALNITFYNNDTTSNHVHISHPDFVNPDIREINESVVKAFMAWLYFEPLFLMMVKKERCDNMYCKRVQRIWTKHGAEEGFKTFGNGDKSIVAQLRHLISNITTPKNKQLAERYFTNDKSVLQNYTILDMFLLLSSAGMSEHDNSKYVTLNMTSLQKLGTIEVRLKHGSNNMDANAHWVQLLAVFFAAAIGQDCVTKLFSDDVKTRFYNIMKAAHDVDTLKKDDVDFLKDQFMGLVKSTLPHAKGAQAAIDYWFHKTGQREGAGGAAAFTKTAEKVLVASRHRVVYVGHRRRKYVRVNGAMVPLSEARRR